MIKAYRIHEFYECHITHKCMVSISFKGAGEFRAMVHPLPSPEFAINYLDGEARDWFLPALENFINHKKHLITGETHPQWKNLLVCQQALEHYEKIPTVKICEKFLKGHGYFVGILPHPNNNSYKTSEEDLRELKFFCEEYLKFKPLTQQKAA